MHILDAGIGRVITILGQDEQQAVHIDHTVGGEHEHVVHEVEIDQHNEQAATQNRSHEHKSSIGRH